MKNWDHLSQMCLRQSSIYVTQNNPFWYRIYSISSKNQKWKYTCRRSKALDREWLPKGSSLQHKRKNNQTILYTITGSLLICLLFQYYSWSLKSWKTGTHYYTLLINSSANNDVLRCLRVYFACVFVPYWCVKCEGLIYAREQW